MAPKINRVPGNYPLTQEREYQKELLKLIRPMNKKIFARISKSYLPIKNQAEREFGIRDSYEDRIEQLMRALGIIVQETMPDKKAREIAERRAKNINNQNKKVFDAQIKKVTGIEFASGNEKWLKPKIKEFSKKNVSLIQNLKQTHLQRIETSVRKGVSNGYPLKRIKEEVKKAAKVSESRAKLIARDQVASLNGELTKVRQQSAGVKSYIWSTSLDERVRDEHARLEGQEFKWSEPPSVGHPGDDINCRCVALPVIDNI